MRLGKRVCMLPVADPLRVIDAPLHDDGDIEGIERVMELETGQA